MASTIRSTTRSTTAAVAMTKVKDLPILFAVLDTEVADIRVTMVKRVVMAAVMAASVIIRSTAAVVVVAVAVARGAVMDA